MPYILVRGNLASYVHKYPWRVLVSGLKASDLEQLSRFPSGGYCDDSTIVYLQHPCVILTALEVLGYKVVASSCTSVKQDYNEYMWTMRRDFSEPDPALVIKTAGSQEHTNSVHQRKSYNPRRVSQWPDSPVQTFDRSPLLNKIYQEELLEKRALRRAAELDVQRKVLELERFQWEYERDKLQSEIRWAHETHMMQLKEERERQLTEQSRTKTVSHIAKRQRSLTPFSPTMSQPGNTVSGKLANVISEENYYYVGVKASPFASDSVVFGLNKAEVWALSKRFPNSGSDVVNGVMIKGPPFSIINALAELGYRVVCSTGEAEILWTLQREL